MFETMNWVDMVLGGVVIVSALIGIGRGLIKEVLSLVAWFVALFVAWRFAQMVADEYIRSFIDDGLISYLAAFGGLFLVTLFAVGLVNLLITQLFSAVGLGGVNRLLGMLFGLLRGALISAVIVFFAGFTPIVNKSWWQEAELVPGFTSFANWGVTLLPDNIQAVLNQTDKLDVDSILSRVSDAALELESVSANPENVATRPNIDAQTRAQQSAQSNALAQTPDAPLLLESTQGRLEDNPALTEELPPLIEDVPAVSNTSIPAITLESTQ